jgi:hypothetical protein
MAREYEKFVEDWRRRPQLGDPMAGNDIRAAGQGVPQNSPRPHVNPHGSTTSPLGPPKPGPAPGPQSVPIPNTRPLLPFGPKA